jgi:hypothetical protein
MLAIPFKLVGAIWLILVPEKHGMCGRNAPQVVSAEGKGKRSYCATRQAAGTAPIILSHDRDHTRRPTGR